MSSHDLASRIDAYADLLLKVGVNLQPGQKLILRTTTAAVALTRAVVARAYDMGSPYVEAIWSDDGVTRARLMRAPEDSLGLVPEPAGEAMVRPAQEGAASRAIDADHPAS